MNNDNEISQCKLFIFDFISIFYNPLFFLINMAYNFLLIFNKIELNLIPPLQ